MINGETERIKVMLVEDDPFWIEQLSRTIDQQEDMTLLAVASTKELAVEKVAVLTPDIMVLDINLTENNLDGIDVAREVSSFSNTKTIMLTSYIEEEVIWDAFDYGVINYLSKTSSHEILHAIRSAHSNNSAIHPDVANILRKGFRRNRKEVKLNVLTSAERDLFELEEKGFTKQEMAKVLHKSLETIKCQFKSIRRKLKKVEWG